MADDDELKRLAERTQRALDDKEVPSMYFNGFTNSLSSADVLTILELNGEPIMKLNMSYTTAKTLAVKLGILVARFEQDVKRDILTTDDVAAAAVESSDDE